MTESLRKTTPVSSRYSFLSPGILALAVMACSPASRQRQAHGPPAIDARGARRVSFANNLGIQVVGNVFYPTDFDVKTTYAGLIVVPPAGGAKEQAAGLYARKMAEKGFVTIAIDASYQGESGGTPRYREDPAARVEDIRGAVDYLSTLSFVEDARIGVLGICAGGGYAVSAAMTERRIKTVGLSVPVNGGAENRGEGPAATIATLQAIAAQRTAEARGGEPRIVPWIPDEYKDSPDLDLREAYQYYRTSRGNHPNWQNKLRFVSMDAVMGFDAFYLSETLLTQPLEIVVGSKEGAFGSNKTGHDLHERAASRIKNLLVVDGASHFDLYDNPRYVEIAIERLSTFFDRNLR